MQAQNKSFATNTGVETGRGLATPGKRADLEVDRDTQVQEPTIGRALAELWKGAMIFAPHIAGCTCAGGFHVPLDPAAVEQDILEFLQHRYRQDGRDALVSFIAGRLADPHPNDFGTWLSQIDAAPLEPKDLRRLVTDIRTTLESMNNAAPAAGGGFVCY